MTVADLLFMLKRLNPDKSVYIAPHLEGRRYEAKSLYVLKGKYVIFGVEEPYEKENST